MTLQIRSIPARLREPHHEGPRSPESQVDIEAEPRGRGKASQRPGRLCARALFPWPVAKDGSRSGEWSREKQSSDTGSISAFTIETKLLLQGRDTSSTTKLKVGADD